MQEVLNKRGVTGVDGILLDLGVSSYQLDNAERGFSYRQNAALDMRMSKSGISAADIVNTYSKEELVRILRDYGEEKFAFKIADRIISEREKAPIDTTLKLADIISSAVPARARRDGHPARKSFQAIRIAVNGELERVNVVLGRHKVGLPYTVVVAGVECDSLTAEILRAEHGGRRGGGIIGRGFSARGGRRAGILSRRRCLIAVTVSGTGTAGKYAAGKDKRKDERGNAYTGYLSHFFFLLFGYFFSVNPLKSKPASFTAFSTSSFTTGTEDTMSILPSATEGTTFSMPGIFLRSSATFAAQCSHFIPPISRLYL